MEKYLLGCMNGVGSDYTGSANTTRNGNACLLWDDQNVLMAMKYRVSEKTRRSLLTKHNKCRNPDGTDLLPWCYVRTSTGTVRSEFCDIPVCNTATKSFRGCIKNNWVTNYKFYKHNITF